MIVDLIFELARAALGLLILAGALFLAPVWAPLFIGWLVWHIFFERPLCGPAMLFRFEHRRGKFR